MTNLDASIIIDGLRAKDMRLFGEMKSVGGAVCGVTRAEVLSGARDTEDREKLLTILDGFQQVTLPDSLWNEVGEILSNLRRSGLAVPLADAVLTTVSISLGIEVWARDAHFQAIQQRIPALKLYRETP